MLAVDLHVLGLDMESLGKGLDTGDGSWARRVVENVENKVVAVAALVLDGGDQVLATRKEGHV